MGTERYESLYEREGKGQSHGGLGKTRGTYFSGVCNINVQKKEENCHNQFISNMCSFYHCRIIP